MTQNVAVEQHSPVQSILLHLIPGFLIGAIYYASLPILREQGFPSMMALMCAVVLVLLPIELGWLLYQGKKRSGRLSLQGVILYRSAIPAWQYVFWIPVLFILVGLIFTLMRPVDAFLREQAFGWLPTLESGLQAGTSRSALIVTWSMAAVFGTLLGPVVEELYFRGYLLPRMAFAGRWAPLLHSLLFGLYHVWTPWMVLTRTLGTLPLAYAVRRGNLTLAIIVHVLANTLDILTAVAFIAKMSGQF